ncbi:hypothetical protein GHT06_019798 [Daphnia sinensis]|uniref:Conserved oligomeric Golgi complex subunit 1 n=1 Tax=Daphnia sinensis TaxID=1820382 RepID=A0AAD5L3E9_9CRUS|nr:hypothetical protein GHT06_019798 [Daphnia sinensis]
MAQELLSSNIDGLFEKMNLDEIQQVLRKMRTEVEKKREDLRVTVGSRYRDLIEAADTITEMKKTAEEVSEHLNSMEDKLGSLKHRQLLGFQTDIYSSEKQKQILGAKKECRILAAQIRLLMELPEIIWKQIEAGSICPAAQIQQLGYHLHTGLSVESGLGGSAANIQNWFPVINQQKVALASFDDIIVKKSTNHLMEIQLTLERATDSCCALLLFRGTDSAQMLSDFLKFRSETMSSIMSQNGIKQQLQSFLQFIVSSFATVHALFVEGFPESKLPQGLLSEKLKATCQPLASPTVQLLSLTPGFIRQLPPIITEFRPSTKEVWTPLPISHIRSEFQKWFHTIRDVIPKELHQLLSCVSHIKTLASLRDLAYNTLQAEPFTNEWSELAHRLFGSDVCLWEELFEPAFVEKISSIIQGKLDHTLDAVQQSIEQNYVNFDLKAWLWAETASDLPQSATSLPNTSGVYMKTRCYMPSVQQLCGLWDQRLAVLREDLAYYQDEKAEDAKLFCPFNKYGKRTKINEALEKCCIQAVHKFVSTLGGKDDNRIMFAMKVTIGMSDLCPQLKLCLDTEQGDEGKSWNSLLEFLRCSALDLFNVWKTDLLASMEQNLESQLQMNSTADTLKFTPMWDEITIQEEAESGNAVQSQIRVPMNPSFPLQQSLFGMCQEINHVGPHAIPKKAQLHLMEDTASSILKCYEKYVSSHSTTLSQAIALQLLFDVRFVGAFLLARDNKLMQEKARNLCESLEGRVDPFDLDVFNPHVQNHVKRAVQRLQFVFGPLLTSDRHAILWAARVANPVGSAKPEAPSVVGLVSSTPRFLSLPLMNQRPPNIDGNNSVNKLAESSSKGDIISVNQRKSKNKVDTAAANATSTARSSAAAFFGAMSSTWGSSIFGGDK